MRYLTLSMLQSADACKLSQALDAERSKLAKQREVQLGRIANSKASIAGDKVKLAKLQGAQQERLAKEESLKTLQDSIKADEEKLRVSPLQIKVCYG